MQTSQFLDGKISVSSVLGEDWGGWFTAVSKASFNCTGLLTALGTGYAMAREFGGDKIQGAAVAMVAFFIMMPTSHLAVRDSGENLVGRCYCFWIKL